MRAGVTVYAGPGFVFHWSFEDGFQHERAEHRTWRLGVVVALRSVRSAPLVGPDPAPGLMDCTCRGEREEAPPVPDPDCPVHG